MKVSQTAKHAYLSSTQVGFAFRPSPSISGFPTFLVRKLTKALVKNTNPGSFPEPEEESQG